MTARIVAALLRDPALLRLNIETLAGDVVWAFHVERPVARLAVMEALRTAYALDMAPEPLGCR